LGVTKHRVDGVLQVLAIQVDYYSVIEGKDRVPAPASRFRQPTSVFYVPPWLSLRWTGGSRKDQALPFVLELPVLALAALWIAIRLIAYPFIVLGRIVALPFRSRPRTAAPG
jgi:hypothetical protein